MLKFMNVFEHNCRRYWNAIITQSFVALEFACFPPNAGNFQIVIDNNLEIDFIQLTRTWIVLTVADGECMQQIPIIITIYLYIYLWCTENKSVVTINLFRKIKGDVAVKRTACFTIFANKTFNGACLRCLNWTLRTYIFSCSLSPFQTWPFNIHIGIFAHFSREKKQTRVPERVKSYEEFFYCFNTRIRKKEKSEQQSAERQVCCLPLIKITSSFRQRWIYDLIIIWVCVSFFGGVEKFK